MKTLSAGLLLVGLACLTHQQSRVWESDLTLWTHTAQWSPHAPRVLNNLGKAYARAGQYQLALDAWQAEIREANDTRRSPYQRAYGRDVANANIAYLLINLGDLQTADELLRALLTVSPEFPPARFNHGALLALRGECDAAREEYRYARQLDWTLPMRELPCRARP